jgi:hypothetical protein
MCVCDCGQGQHRCRERQRYDGMGHRFSRSVARLGIKSQPFSGHISTAGVSRGSGFFERGLAAHRAPIPFIRGTNRALLIGIDRFRTTDTRTWLRFAVCELRVAGRAELLLVAFQAGFNSGRARNIRRTQSKRVSHAGRCLLAGALRVCRCRHRQHRARERQRSDGYPHSRSSLAHRKPS